MNSAKKMRDISWPWRPLLVVLILWVPTDTKAQVPRLPETGVPAQAPYRVYVANESSDVVSRVAFTPGEGAIVEKEIPVGIMPGDNDGAHGISVSPDGRYWYVTIAHGTPYGYVWKYHAGPDTLVGRTRLGLFPATMGLTPDGQFLLAANFNLHGDMTPSTVSVVYTPDMVEVTKIETCLMPHGSRIQADGTRQYSVCMHSEQLVEIDVATFQVSARFDLTPEREGILAVSRADGVPEEGSPPLATRRGKVHTASHSPSAETAPPSPSPAAVCSPTWVEPGTGMGANRVVYVACNRNREILEVDTDLWEVSRRFLAGTAPYNLEVTAGGKRLVATLKGEQAVAIFDLESGTLLGRVETSRPVTHGVVASTDGRFAFITNESVGSVLGTLDVIDLETLELVDSIELGYQSGGIDFWPGPPVLGEIPS